MFRTEDGPAVIIDAIEDEKLQAILEAEGKTTGFSADISSRITAAVWASCFFSIAS